MKSARKCHILEEHYLDFYSRALSILDDEDDAKDAVQEAIVKTLVRVGVRDVVAYCFRATENESINLLRRRRRRVQLDESTMVPDYGEERLKRDLRESKELLLPMERKVWEMRREHGYNNIEIADKTGVSTATVKRLLLSAENKMKYIMLHEI